MSVTFALEKDVASFEVAGDLNLSTSDRVVINGLQLLAVRSLPFQVLFDFSQWRCPSDLDDYAAISKALVQLLLENSENTRIACLAEDDLQFTAVRYFIAECELNGISGSYFRNKVKALEWLREQRDGKDTGVESRKSALRVGET